MYVYLWYYYKNSIIHVCIFHSGKPVILLSGDDDGRAYMFEPNSQSPDDWSYTKVTFCDAGDGTVGELSAGDIDADGYLEVIVPSYSKDEVIVYSFKPEEAVQTTIVGWSCVTCKFMLFEKCRLYTRTRKIGHVRACVLTPTCRLSMVLFCFLVLQVCLNNAKSVVLAWSSEWHTLSTYFVN